MGEIMQKTFRVKKTYVHRKVARKDVLIPIGGNIANFNGFIELNETAAFLWDELKIPCTGDMLSEKITVEFDVPLEIARQDVKEMLQMFLNNEMIEEI